jgi:hypothetical protein
MGAKHNSKELLAEKLNTFYTQYTFSLGLAVFGLIKQKSEFTD